MNTPSSCSWVARVLLLVGLTAGCTAQVESVARPSGGGGSPGSGGPGKGGTGSVVGGTGNSTGTGNATGTGNSIGSGATGGAPVLADPNAAGPRPLRLLSAREYLNTVRDLLGDTTATTADGLPTGDEALAASPTFAFRVDHPVSPGEGTLYETAAEVLAKNAVAHLATLLPCATPTLTGAAATTCLNTFLTTFMPKVYRRPLSATEVSTSAASPGPLAQLFNIGTSTLALGFNDAIGLLLEAALQSPEFLYHWEQDPNVSLKALLQGGVVPLGDYELANRLSYFLWESMPDQALFGAAAAKQLTASAAGVETQVRRMLKDPKTGPAMVDFFKDWLDVDLLAGASKDQVAYPNFNDALVSDMLGEFSTMITNVVVNGSGRFGDLLTGTSSVASQALASLYGITGVTGTALRAVTLNPAQRSGILTSAAFLSMTGDSNTSNPPRRGKAIYTKILCGQLVPPLPAVVPPLAADRSGTVRQYMEMHDKSPCTTGCHNIIEPFGFAFEEYGGIGDFRTLDNKLPVDASGTVTLDGQSRSFTNAPGLIAILATSPTALSCFATQWLRYGVGRFETPADQASLNAAATAFIGASGDIREMLVGLSTSRTFRYRAPAPGEVLQ